MRRLRMTLFACVVGSLLAFTAGCRTCPEVQYTLPPDLPAPDLRNTDDPLDIERDFVTLVGQDIKWRIKMNTARWIIGEITDEEYAEIDADLQRRLAGG